MFVLADKGTTVRAHRHTGRSSERKNWRRCQLQGGLAEMVGDLPAWRCGKCDETNSFKLPVDQGQIKNLHNLAQVKKDTMVVIYQKVVLYQK